MPPPILVADPQFRHPSQVSKMLEQMQKGYYSFSPSETWQPNVNLYETDEYYMVCVDLAGVDKEKIDLEVIEQRLILKGSRPVPPCPCKDEHRIRVHLMEIDHGAFAREVELPLNVQRERISARYLDGLLWIELPKK